MSFLFRRFVILQIFLIPLFSLSQNISQVSGRVIDSKTKAPLAFVNIIVNGDNLIGSTTDIDGKFSIHSAQHIKKITLTYVGYEKTDLIIGPQNRNLVIPMTSKEVQLNEVEILPGINPAHRIIRHVIDNREFNDPEKLRSFSYTSYDKTIFTLDIDTAKFAHSKMDTTHKPRQIAVELGFSSGRDSIRVDTSSTLDSATYILNKFISRQNLFEMENVTKRKFMAPERNYNQVIATKMSGFQDPIFVFLATQIQSFSFYKPFISILQKTYINPISPGSLSKYFFKIEDTLYSGKDSIFVIKFRPRRETNFDGIEGVISINNNGWAIQNVIAEPHDAGNNFKIRIQQQYELIDGAHWFPTQLNTDVFFNTLRVGRYRAIGTGRSYIRDIVLNPDLVRREFDHLDIEVEKDANKKKDEFWNKYRIDSLTQKDRRTYEVLDSLGKAENFDKTAKTLQTLISGRIPWSVIDIDINRFLNYNTYEGFVLGAGIHSNDLLSKRFRFGGFYQYAFAISTHKYGGDLSYLINRRHDVSVRGEYFYDLIPSGSVRFFDDSRSILTGNWEALLIKKSDRTENVNLSLSLRPFKYLLCNVSLSRSIKKSTTFDLSIPYNNSVLLYNSFAFTELTAGFKWAYGEKFIQTVDNKISLGTNYPIVWLQYTRGIKGMLDGQYDYNKIDLKIKKTFKLKYLGKLSFQLNAGYVDQPIPATNLYYGNASYRLVTIFAPNTFATMRMNEFLSDKYANLFITHDFGYLLFKGRRWFHPEFVLSQNIGFGWLDHAEKYKYNLLKPRQMNLGYYESGLLINNLVNLRLYTVGIGVFYRWGPYSFNNTGDNFAYKLTLLFPF
ncbi:MAG: DUF5686 family protein [Bacteroidota bacterium]|nr:DUF5686 family protein [Bacteroidota bacterium]